MDALELLLGLHPVVRFLVPGIQLSRHAAGRSRHRGGTAGDGISLWQDHTGLCLAGCEVVREPHGRGRADGSALLFGALA